MTLPFKLGRRPRAHSPLVPHLSALLAGHRGALPPPAAAVSYAKGLPADLGMMGNSTLGDCTCAGYYHALQVWSNVARQGAVDTEPDSDAILLYEQACGYVPGQPSTDQGGVEQAVLSFLLNTGAPVGPGGAQRHKLLAFFEVDPSNTDDVKRAIADCGVCYIGFNVPAYLMQSVPQDWTIGPEADDSIVGGHCVILIGYDADWLELISWGRVYRMSWAFFAQFCDEAYALIDGMWIETTGKTPLGISLYDLEQQMAALRGWHAGTPYAPTGQLVPTAHSPELLQAKADRNEALARAADAEGRVMHVEGVAKELAGTRDRQALRIQELERQVDTLKLAATSHAAPGSPV